MAIDSNDLQGPSSWGSPRTIENAATGTSDHAYLELKVSGTGAGDPHVRFTIPSGTSWYEGPDNSDSDTLKWGTGTAVGTTTLMKLTTGGTFTVENGGTEQGSISSAGVVNARVQMSVGSVPFATSNATNIDFGSISGSFIRTLRLYSNDVANYVGGATEGVFSSLIDVRFGGGTGVLATTATVGFPVIPTCAGTPTGAADDGAIIVDSTNNKLYFRSSGVWRDAGP